MKIGILHVGRLEKLVLERVRENLSMVFSGAKCMTLPEIVALPREAFDAARGQYRSDMILGLVRSYAEKTRGLTKVLGVVDVDIFVPGLNFVFGEADCPGRAAIISLWRLRPEFYGKPQNFELFVERATKEAVHELGHTFGLGHCVNPFCVMYFSNSIFDTDRKKSLFCNMCQVELPKFSRGD
ncbi:MAG: archaemetzincin family Zn-dependent metalloprotease [Nitrososphaerota archaeon]|nr:archaemetzincin family Zn-dependent metalloprotease [Candidatus Bathyarchaeota archaeon]MDW8023501.1 archaemetzincin family Zn-dependent metalloprotease [Nitrososphaerota archaeon]